MFAVQWRPLSGRGAFDVLLTMKLGARARGWRMFELVSPVDWVAELRAARVRSFAGF